MRTTMRASRTLLALVASLWLADCGSDSGDGVTGPNDSTPFTAYLEVKILSSTGIDAVRGGYAGFGNSGQDTDPAPDRLLVTDVGQGGWYRVWFETPRGGEVTFTVRTRAVYWKLSNCLIPPNGEFGPSVFDAVLTIGMPEGEFDAREVTECKSVSR
jgi:hypothetical protein